MPKRTSPLLKRFPLFSTSDLTEAQRRTGSFWPSHTSEVLGPEDYAVDMFRVLLANTTLTFVDCTTRIRVLPTEATKSFLLFAPLDGTIAVEAGGSHYLGSPLRPLLMAPARGDSFEASPIRCLVADIEPTALQRAAAAAGAVVPSHMVLAAEAAVDVKQQLVGLAMAANRSTALAGLQTEASAARSAAISAPLRRCERMLLEAIAAACLPGPWAHREAVGGLDLAGLKRWIHAHLADTIRIPDLAAEAGLSPKSLTRAFARMGVTPLEFVRSLRLEKAHRLLVDATDTTTVTDVALAVGCPNLSLFSRTYRRRYGEKPSETLDQARARKQQKLS